VGAKGNEIKGGLKEGLGKLTGDESLEQEGRSQKQIGRTQRKAGGAVKEAGGNVKKAAGKALDSPSLKAEGEADRLRGRVERQ
jgi:uncharacterized protein YjbJ (UPF0337 family)